MNERNEWKVSLHGGHSGDYCDHAAGTLREVLDAAVAQGYHTFGVSEHAPRIGDEFLYDTERDMGWDVAKIEADFERYAADSCALIDEFSAKLCVLRGFEIEVVPHDRYASIMLGLRERHAFDYIVGSVHFVEGVTIDGPMALFEKALDMQGGLENLGERYYESVAEMVEALKPEVVGHLDLIRKNAPSNEAVETPRLRDAALRTLDVIAWNGGILDLNTAGYRKGLGSPYPAPWLVRAAAERNIGFCFGDDSHGPEQVGAGIEEARQYLLDLGVTHITALTRAEGGIQKNVVSLE
jgi:histidinol-phosphatase (PHP family)